MNERKLLAMRMFREAKERERLAPAQKVARAIPFDAYDRDGDQGGRTGDGTDDINIHSFLSPDIDTQLTLPGSALWGISIMDEIQEAEVNGTLAPFIEGTPIGAYELRESNRPARSLIPDGQFRQEAMLKLRRKNDADLAKLLT